MFRPNADAAQLVCDAAEIKSRNRYIARDMNLNILF
jgi:hypothetical protein